MTTSIRTLACSIAFALAALVGGSALAAPATAELAASPDTGDASARFDAAVELEGQINVNTASEAELELLPGVGPAIAGRIVSYRAKRPFKHRSHVMRVKGVGKKTYLKIKPFLAVEGETTLRVAGK